MQRFFKHEISYDFDERATIDEIAASLVANGRFVRDAVAVIASCQKGLEVSDLKVSLSSVTQNSPLKEVLVLSLLTAFQPELEEEVPDLIKALTAVDVPDRFDSLVTVFFVGVTLYAALKLVDRAFKDRSTSKIKEAYGAVTHVAGDLIQVSPDIIRDRINHHVGGERSRLTAKYARDFFRPAQKYHARSIETNAGINIDREVINELPSEVDERAFEPRLDWYDIFDVLINLRAQDLDKDKTGWAAVIEVVSPYRLKLFRNFGIPAEVLFSKTFIRGDVRVHIRENDKGDWDPYLYELMRVFQE